MSENLLNRSLSALKWSYFGVAARVALQLIAQITIARLIGPKDFGAASAAIFVMTVGSLIIELGLGSALIQKKNEVTPDDVRLVFRRIAIAVTSISIAVLFAAEYIADFWGDPSVAPLVQMLVLAMIAQAGGIVSLALLRRALEFKWIQLAQIFGYFVGFFVVGITVAYFGGGPWSLIFAWVTQNICTTLLLFWRKRHRIDFWKSISKSDKKLLPYGFRILCTNIANWTIENIDNFIVGRAFGTQALGSYTVSYNLVRTPANHLVTSIQQVLFPASARSNGNNTDHSLTFLLVVWGVSLVTFPLFLSVAALAEIIVNVFYGAKWESAVTILVPLAIAMPFHAIMSVGGPILWGRGEANKEMKVQFFVALLLIITLGSMVTTSPELMAWAVAGIYVVRAVWIQLQLSASLKIPPAATFRSIFPGLLAGSIVSCTLMLIDSLLVKISLDSIPRLLVACMSAMGMALIVVCSVKLLLPKSLRIALEERNDIPAILLRLLRLK